MNRVKVTAPMVSLNTKHDRFQFANARKRAQKRKAAFASWLKNRAK